VEYTETELIAYLLLAHGNPAHLQRLIARLRSDGTAFFIHVDKKADQRLFAHLKADDVTLLPAPVAVHWGDFSQVEAILLLMKTALAAGPFTVSSCSVGSIIRYGRQRPSTRSSPTSRPPSTSISCRCPLQRPANHSRA
jgi:hypothetical protein